MLGVEETSMNERVLKIGGFLVVLLSAATALSDTQTTGVAQPRAGRDLAAIDNELSEQRRLLEAQTNELSKLRRRVAELEQTPPALEIAALRGRVTELSRAMAVLQHKPADELDRTTPW